ncbi:MAG: SMUG2 DNA glycosylase family protein [bacterium]|nr:SMUG2 DNA glycosylase family protein [bacterium]
MPTFAESVIKFNSELNFNKTLPDKIRIMNPFKNNPDAVDASQKFYKKYYNDNKRRRMILGINPGRHGAGSTGIPFTDTKRLEQICNINFKGMHTHEPSSVFIYKLIEAFGGVKKFYNKFYINSLCPLGFVFVNEKGKEINYNYYDNEGLYETVKPFIIESIRKQIKFGMNTDVCYCLGTGKNYKYMNSLNNEQKFFDQIVPLEHPRYIVQYKSKKMNEYAMKFVNILKQNKA